MGGSRLSRSRWRWLWLVALTLNDAEAGHRMVIQPAVEIREVLDDNVYFADEAPVRDRIRRISPGLAMRFESDRWTIRGAYEIDSETFEVQSALDSDRARERALIDIEYDAGPRLTLSLNGGYIIDTLAELNVETGLGASRTRAEQLKIRPSARFRFSPRLVATVTASSADTDVEDGTSIAAHTQTFLLERTMSTRDLLTLDYQHTDLRFSHRGDLLPVHGATPSVNTHALLAGWSRSLGAQTQFALRAGPRFTGGSPEAEFAASLSHQRRSVSFAVSMMQTQTTVIGHLGLVDTQGLQAKVTYSPTRKLAGYAAPALIRSTDGAREAVVYRFGIGARYAITRTLAVDLAYHHDDQNGTIDPLRRDAQFSRSTLSFGLSARWNGEEQRNEVR